MRKFSREERRGALLLSALIIAVIAASFAVRGCGRQSEDEVTPRVIYISTADSVSSQSGNGYDADGSESGDRRVGKKSGRKHRHSSSRKRHKSSRHKREKASATEQARDFLRDTITVIKSDNR